MTQFERLVGFTIITCSLLAAQNVNVEHGTWSASGIELTPYSSPTFAGKLAAITPASPRFDATPLHPFSFFLTNNTGRNIIAYSVLWTIKDTSGFVSQHHRLVGSLKSPNGNLSIPKGADRLVTVLNGAAPPIVDNPRRDSRMIEGVQSSVPSAVRMFPGKGGDVTITLEAVVLDDGLALGTDSTHAISRMQAQVEAQKTLASNISTAFSGGGDQAVVDLLTSIVSTKNAPNVLTASRMSSSSDAYAAFLIAYRHQMAANFVAVAKSNPAVLMKLINTQLNETSFAVHR